MTLYAKILEERDEAQIEQLIETSRLYNAPDRKIVENLMSKFNLSEEEALEKIREFDLQPA